MKVGRSVANRSGTAREGEREREKALHSRTCLYKGESKFHESTCAFVTFIENQVFLGAVCNLILWRLALQALASHRIEANWEVVSEEETAAAEPPTRERVYSVRQTAGQAARAPRVIWQKAGWRLR